MNVDTLQHSCVRQRTVMLMLIHCSIAVLDRTVMLMLIHCSVAVLDRGQ